jgi:molybdenum cofactor guanylyltransferase
MSFAILLVGGQSTRMGQDKSTLTIDNETLLQRALTLLNNSAYDHILISGAIDGHQSIPDLIPECGPLGGIYSSLTYIRDKYSLDNSPVLIIPVDMPMLNAQALEKVTMGVSDAQCCHYANEVFPCVMRASESLYTYLKEAFVESTALGGKRSMKGLMKHLDANIISTDGLSERVFLNVNYPEDWEKING